MTDKGERLLVRAKGDNYNRLQQIKNLICLSPGGVPQDPPFFEKREWDQWDFQANIIVTKIKLT